MTAYFDRIVTDVGAARAVQATNEAGTSLWEQLGVIEERLVTDCTIAVEFPGCPEEIREAVHRTILRHAVQCLPVNAPPADFEHDDEYAERMLHLESDLHTIFHSLARMGLERFSDDPRTPVRCLYADGEARRERMIAPTMLPTSDPPTEGAAN